MKPPKRLLSAVGAQQRERYCDEAAGHGLCAGQGVSASPRNLTSACPPPMSHVLLLPRFKRRTRPQRPGDSPASGGQPAEPGFEPGLGAPASALPAELPARGPSCVLLPRPLAAGPTWPPPSAWRVASATEEPNLNFHLSLMN